MSAPRGQASDKEKSEALAQMNLTKIARAYLQQVIDEGGGFKALLLDQDTMRACSMLYGRTELAEHNVVHIEKLEANDGKEHSELKALVFVRPTRENITHLKRELRKPRYQSYYLFFTNLVSPIYVQELAEADSIHEVVQQVQEFYGDFIVVDPHHFVLPCSRPEVLINPKLSTSTSAQYDMVDRFVAGLSALFLAIRRRPVIRYQKGSENASRVADSLYTLTYQQQASVFDFGARSNPVVLILDRKDDPVTPLLSQWTYQAMAHQLVGIKDNTVALTSPKVPEQFREIVLDARQDEFFRANMYANYGDVGVAVKHMVDSFSSSEAKHRQLNTIDDMRRFVTEHSDFQRTQNTVSKHVNLMGQLSEAVSRRHLMDVSMAEQELANPAMSLTAAASADDVMGVLRNSDVSPLDKIRIVMLYALRFEADPPRIRGLLEYLDSAGVAHKEPQGFLAIQHLLRYAGSSQRAGDLYASRSLLHKAKNLVKGLQGVDNVYTQHTPLLSETLSQLTQNTLPVASYPYASSQDEGMAWQAMYKKAPPREVIMFIVGGTTYEEAKAVAEWNDKQGASCRVILGGSGILNSDLFMDALTSEGPVDSSALRISIH